MLLAIDTATRWTGIAIHDGRRIVAEIGWYSANTQNVELAPAVADLLRRSDIKASELAAVAVAIGPGSYTGLRIGLGLAKGIAVGTQTRLIGVPTLDILAAGVPPAENKLAVIAEAGRNRVCAGFYNWKPRGWKASGRPLIENWDTLLASIDEPAIFAGEISPAAATLVRTAGKGFRLATPAASVRRAGYLAQIGWLRLRRGRTDDPAQLAPTYLRDPAGKSIPAS